MSYNMFNLDMMISKLLSFSEVNETILKEKRQKVLFYLHNLTRYGLLGFLGMIHHFFHTVIIDTIFLNESRMHSRSSLFFPKEAYRLVNMP